MRSEMLLGAEPLAKVGSADARCREWLGASKILPHKMSRQNARTPVTCWPSLFSLTFCGTGRCEAVTNQASFRTQSHLLKRGFASGSAKDSPRL
jgi:hypothetical protein